jgi:hypothetical protein
MIFRVTTQYDEDEVGEENDVDEAMVAGVVDEELGDEDELAEDDAEPVMPPAEEEEDEGEEELEDEEEGANLLEEDAEDVDFDSFDDKDEL